MISEILFTVFENKHALGKNRDRLRSRWKTSDFETKPVIACCERGCICSCVSVRACCDVGC